MQKFTIVKLDAHGKEKLHYSGKVITRDPSRVIVESHFTNPDQVFSGIPFKKGDPFYEVYYHKRWYNIDEIYDKDDGRLKGWYCNIAYPPKISRWGVTYIDLALDLLVYPDGRQLVLDGDELDALHLPEDTLKQVWGAMKELQEIFSVPADFRLRRDKVARQMMA